MRLISLYIEQYKNIKNQTFDFSGNTGYIALIGLNGSGKSNLLEAICLIFNGLINKKKIPFNFEIVYEHDGKKYLRKKGQASINGKRANNNDMLYPSSVIACYSGEDLRLWHMAFEDYYMHYFKRAVDNLISTPELVYISKYCWSIALLALFSSDNGDVKSFLNNTLSMNSPDEVDVVFSFSESENYKNHQALRWIERIRAECLDKEGRATLRSLLSYDIPLLPNHSKADTLFHYLYLLTQPKKNSDKGNSIDRYITSIRIEHNGIPTYNLSEGHKKLILIECITKVLGDDITLVLFDEPDAHVHISMKKDLLKLISSFRGQTIMTTHSPMFLNKRWDGYIDNNIFYMREGRIENSDPLKHLSELSNNELDFFEGSFILSSKKILVVEGKYDDKYLAKAISVFSIKDSKYSLLNDVAIYSANSASGAEVIYNQIFKPCISKIEKLVFIFDYDKGGFQDGWDKINQIKDAGEKVVPLFYQHDYKTLYTTEPKLSDTVMIEDFFSKDSYTSVVAKVHVDTHKAFRLIQWDNGIKGTANAIKNYIEKHYESFDDDWYDGFKPVLDELLDVFVLK